MGYCRAVYATVLGYCSSVHSQVKHLNIGLDSLKKNKRTSWMRNAHWTQNVGQSIPHLVYGSEKLYNEDFSHRTFSAFFSGAVFSSSSCRVPATAHVCVVAKHTWLNSSTNHQALNELNQVSLSGATTCAVGGTRGLDLRNTALNCTVSNQS